jgi:hypothetical protein
MGVTMTLFAQCRGETDGAAGGFGSFVFDGGTGSGYCFVDAGFIGLAFFGDNNNVFFEAAVFNDFGCDLFGRGEIGVGFRVGMFDRSVSGRCVGPGGTGGVFNLKNGCGRGLGRDGYGSCFDWGYRFGSGRRRFRYRRGCRLRGFRSPGGNGAQARQRMFARQGALDGRCFCFERGLVSGTGFDRGLVSGTGLDRLSGALGGAFGIGRILRKRLAGEDQEVVTG